MAPVNTPKTIANDPQFKARFQWYPAAKHGADMLPFPVKLINETVPEPSMAPALGEHTDKVLAEVLGYDKDKIATLREAGVVR
jgi:crotonobetainyl-CoA:carnitine CoA-transferase CaiB-like acyl-CoA transferase